ncbi:tetratricopeptide repeat protein [Candidatus Dependentiae bacterium]|nr:tetratricopeptide repeat protein [Candidatus Dependentiae bacterium]
MKKGIILISILFISFYLSSFLDPLYDLNRRGNRNFKGRKYEDAFGIYEKALELNNTHPKIFYNQGNTLYKADNFDEAVKKYQDSLDNLHYYKKDEDRTELRYKLLHNIGNSNFKKQDFKSAIKSYEDALKIQPDAEDTKFNLELAKKMLEEQQKQQQKQQDKKNQNCNKPNQNNSNNSKQNQQNNNQNSSNNNSKQNQDQTQPQDPSSNSSTGKGEEREGNNPNELSDKQIDNILKKFIKNEQKLTKKYFKRRPKEGKDIFSMTPEEIMKELDKESGSNQDNGEKNW